MKNYSPNWLVATLSFGRSLEKIFLLQFFFLFISFSVLQATVPTEDKIPDKAPLSAAEMTACDNGRIFVDADAANNGDGIAWGSAYNKLQDALAEACACGNAVEIWVAAGTYYPDEDEGGIQTDDARSSSFNLCNNVALYGGFVGTEASRTERDFENNITILSGDLQQDDSQQPIITDVSMVTGTGNNAYTVVTGSNTDNTAILDGFTITAGHANGNGDLENFSGGGMFNDEGSPSISNVIFVGNNGGRGGGGGMRNDGGMPIITNAIFRGNSADIGGGMNNNGASPIIINTVFSGNNAIELGGGMINSGASPFITNTVFSGNNSDLLGGAMYNNLASRPRISNTIIWDNQQNGSTTVPGASINNIDNTSIPRISFSIIANSDDNGNWESDLGTDNGNNQEVNPLFITPINPNAAPTSEGNFRLQTTSLGINMGNNAVDLDGNGSGTQTIADIPTDLAGVPRIFDTTVDIGAYEFSLCPLLGSDNSVVYVDSSLSSSGDGLTWGTAFTKLQDALRLACGCSEITEIWVAAGTYYPDEGVNQTDDDRNSSFQMCDNVAIYGGFVGTEASLQERDVASNLTVLSGDLRQNDSQQPVITNRATVTGVGDNAFRVVNGSGTDHTAIIDGFTVTAGNTFEAGTSGTRSGGGFFINNGSPVISQVIISGNSARDGGGISNINSNPILTNVIISGNVSVVFGGGMYNLDSNPNLTNVTISGNGSGEFGGGIYNNNSGPILTNMVISGNFTRFFGGGILNSNNSNPILTNVIIWNNQADGSTASTRASIFNNDSGSSTSITYSLVQNITTNTDNNIDGATDPLFVAPLAIGLNTGGDYRLQPTSPAINMGNNAADIDGASGTMTIADVPTDLAGNPRIQQTTVDMGAYEQLGCPASGSNLKIFVNAANATPGDGSDWSNAFDNLQDALRLACGCSEITEIWVAAGTYYPDEGVNQTDDDRNSSFQMCDNVAIYGGFVGTEASLQERDVASNLTVLSGDLRQNDSQQPVITDRATVTGVGNNAFRVVNGSGTDHTAIIDGFTVTAGNTFEAGTSGTRSGGGFFINNGSPVISQVIISGNSARDGGGISNINSNPILTNVIISGNVSVVFGGGMYNLDSNPNLTNVTISGNGSGEFGGGIYNNNSGPILTNMVISGNFTRFFGGGILNSNNSNPILTNVIIWNNQADGSTASTRASIFNNDSGSSTSITFSLVQNITTNTDNNIDGATDPLFVAPLAIGLNTGGDYRLQPTSPAINMGNNAADIDGASGTMTIADVPTDLAGNPRIQQATVDLGAYEQLGCPTSSGSNLKIFVNAANATPGDGLTWTGAYDKLQDALEVACNCTEVTEIWVAAGTYYPDEGVNQTDNARNSSFQMCDNVAIYGGFAGTEDPNTFNLVNRDLVANETILSGDIDGDDDAFAPTQDSDTDANTPTQTDHINGNNALSVVTAMSINATAILDGFRITAGNADVSSVSFSESGGGFYAENSSPILSNVFISGNNAARFGGGIYNDTSNPSLMDVTLSDNSAGSAGGGIFNTNASPLLTRTSILNNIAGGAGGGGVFNLNANPKFINVTILGNSTIGDGGGINNDTSNPLLTNVLLSGNKALDFGGGILNNNSNPVITNSTLSGNNVQDGGGGISNFNNSAPIINNTIIWNNMANGNTAIEAASISNNNSTPVINNSIIANLTPSGTNKNMDPEFLIPVNPATAPTTVGDLRLEPTSPAINMGDNAADIDGAGGMQTIADITTDLAGENRIQQTTVDMGAYEQLGCPDSGSNLKVFVNAANATPGDGLDWSNAFDNLQDALRLACGCSEITEIWVAAGTYYPDEGFGQMDNERSSTFQLCNNVAIYGGFAGTEDPNTFNLVNRDLVANETILSGDIDGDDDAFAPTQDSDTDANTPTQTDHINGNNAFSVVTARGVNATAILDGFWITAGNSDIRSIPFNESGGGFYAENSSPILSNVFISGNNATRFGGGIYNDTSNPSLMDVTLSDNSAGSAGGGIFNTNASPLLTRTSILNNIAGGAGGGGVFNLNASPNFTNVTILGNSTNGDGGGINNDTSNPLLTNVLLSGNKAREFGGGILNNNSNPVITNSTLSGNNVLDGGGGISNFNNSAPIINNTIIWNNMVNGNTVIEAASISNNNSTPVINNSIIANFAPSGTNKNMDPEFLIPVNPATAPTTAGDLRLEPTSPAINMGNNAADIDGAGGMQTIADIATDLAGENRILESIVDMGAYEQLSCAGLIPAAMATSLDVATNTVTLDGNDPGSGAGQWSIISGDGNGYFGNTPGTLTASDPTASFTGTLGQTYTLEWEISLGDCESSIQVMITFNCSAVVATATSQAFEANTISLNGSDPAMGTGQWRIISGDGNGYFGDTPRTLTTNNPISTFTGTPRQEYTLEWKIIEGNCDSSVQIMLTIPEVEEIPLFASPWAKLGFSMLLLGLMSLLMLHRRF